MFDPILSASLAVHIHLVAAVLALVLGPVAIYRKRRDWVHKGVGRTWVGVMVVVAVSGLFIPAQVLPLIGMFGPIHIFSVWVFLTLTTGVRAILRGDVARHRAAMQALYWQGLGIAGVLTLLPGRQLNAVLFGGSEEIGVWVIVGVVGVAALIFGLRRGRNLAARRGRNPIS
ncbi:MAG: DUF2306 domain-containing protein [Roseicyclus sp.]|nr:DUF2306 domain-containing protein [Roseicyclus sp.]